MTADPVRHGVGSLSPSPSPSPSPGPAGRSVVQERLLAAAAAVFAEEGWRKLTMTKVADRADLSRQTVYNEFGTKPNLAEALVFRELDSFLALVRSHLHAHCEPVPAISAAVEGALELAARNPLLKAVLESAHTGDSELLPFITQSSDLVNTAAAAVSAEMRQAFPDLPMDDSALRQVCDAVVRLVLSHVTQPSGSPEEVGSALGWAMGALLRGIQEPTARPY